MRDPCAKSGQAEANFVSAIGDTSAVAELFQLKVTLREVKPAVWRRMLVPGTMKLSVLNAVILAAMGWTGYHLYEFRAAGRAYGEPDEEFGDDVLDANRHHLSEIANVGGWFTHHYDFGDGWVHCVTVESVTEVAGRSKPSCIAGCNACPPEDVGGPYGYSEFLAAIRDPKHEDHAHLLDWAGGAFDPTAFDLEETNTLVSRVTLPTEQF